MLLVYIVWPLISLESDCFSSVKLFSFVQIGFYLFGVNIALQLFSPESVILTKNIFVPIIYFLAVVFFDSFVLTEFIFGDENLIHDFFWGFLFFFYFISARKLL